MWSHRCRDHYPEPVERTGSNELAAICSASVELIVPVFNEEKALPGCVSVLHAHLHERFPFDWTITVVDNASTDSTPRVAEDIAAWCPRIRTMRLDRRGKGHAIRTAWSTSPADIVAYMDVDLSTGLDALLPLIVPLANGHSDIAIGSRLAPGSRTVRGTRRELISRAYNAILRMAHGARFSDAQCGFKAARTAVIRPLLERVEDDSWFFDTELLLLAEHNGLRVHEVAVDWVEDLDSRVRVGRAAVVNLRGMARLAVAKASGRAGVVGLPSRPPPSPAHPDAVLPAARRSGRPGVRLPTVVGAGALGLYALLRLRWSPAVALAGAVAWCLALTRGGLLRGRPRPRPVPAPVAGRRITPVTVPDLPEELSA